MREQQIRGNDLSQLSDLIAEKEKINNNSNDLGKNEDSTDAVINKPESRKDNEIKDKKNRNEPQKSGKKIDIRVTGNKDKSLLDFQKRKKNELKDLREPATRLADRLIEYAVNQEAKLTEEEAINLLKKNQIDEVIVSGGEIKTKGENGEVKKIMTFGQDLDSKLSNYILNISKGGDLNKIYSENARATVLHTRMGQNEPEEKVKGLRLFLDAGGSWMNFDIKGKTTTLRFDHHGHGQREATSGAKMIYEFLKKGNLIEADKGLERFINFVTEVDNLSYLNNVDERGQKTFNEEYFKNVWPNTLYAIAEKIPFNVIKDLITSGKIEDPSKPLTEEQLNGEIGSIKAGNLTIKELCIRAKEGDRTRRQNIDGSIKTIEGIKNAKRYAKQQKLNLENTFLGNVIYSNFGKVTTAEGKEFQVKIKSDLAFIGTKALGYDTYVNWNNAPDEKKFFINSTLGNLGAIAARLNKIDSSCATEVRETFLFGKINNLTEAEFLNAIDPRIIKDSNIKMKREKFKVNKKVSETKESDDNKENHPAEGPETTSEQTKKVENNDLMEKLLKMIEEDKKREERISWLKQYILDLEKEEENGKTEIKTAPENKEGEKNLDEHEKLMNDLRKEYEDSNNKINNLLEKRSELEKEKDKVSRFNILKKFSLNGDIKECNELINYFTMNKIAAAEHFNQQDRIKHPFAYYIADKIKNPSVRKSLTRNGLRVQKGVDREYISLELINSIQDDKKIIDPMKILGSFDVVPEVLGYNDTVRYNIYGFCIKTMNREEITDEKDNIINLDSPKAKFKVIGVNGNKLMEQASYKEAYQRYQEETEKYKKQVEEEFKNLENKK